MELGKVGWFLCDEKDLGGMRGEGDPRERNTVQFQYSFYLPPHKVMQVACYYTCDITGKEDRRVFFSTQVIGGISTREKLCF